MIAFTGKGKAAMTVKVLLVENSLEVRKSLRHLLVRMPDIDLVGEAEDGRTALAMLRSRPVDVVVIDINLPEISGLPAARRILVEKPRVRVLVLSLQSDPLYVKESFKSGAAGYLLKDWAFEELEEAIHTVAAGEVFVSPKIETRLP
jgi:DNA-binding NarL/FixJ family response regulator